MISYLIPFYYFMIYGTALATAAAPVIYAPEKWMQLTALVFSPVLFTCTFILVAGLLSMTGRHGVKPGSFPRDLKDKVYGPRRLYGACWTSVFYLTPVYFLALTIPPLKKMLFRLFGYRGSMDFVVYPDSWIRDLPCLLFEDGAYIANKCTLGTNICLANGTILVDRIKIGKRAMVGHMAIIGAGSKLRDGVEVGVSAGIGIRCELKSNAKVMPCSVVNHGVIVGENTSLGMHSFIGLRAQIGPNIIIPAGGHVPAGAVLKDQAEADALFSHENENLQDIRKASIERLEAEAMLKSAA